MCDPIAIWYLCGQALLHDHDHYYPRLILTFGYCHRLRLWVCVSVCVYQSRAFPHDNSSLIQFGLLAEHKFCRKLSRSISIESRCCNRFINLGRPIFTLNHSGASAASGFTIPTTFVIAHAQCYTRAERATQSATRVGSSLRDSVWYVVLIQTQLQYILSSWDTLFFFASTRTSNPPFLQVGCDSWWRNAVEPASWLRNDLSIPRAPENVA